MKKKKYKMEKMMNQMIDEYQKFIKVIELIKINYMIYFNILKYNHFQL